MLLGSLFYLCSFRDLYAAKWLVGFLDLDLQFRWLPPTVCNGASYSVARGIVPDAAWAFSFAAFVGIVWELQRHSYSPLRSVLLGGGTGVSYELGQFFHLFPGTFDWVDLGISFLAGWLAILVINLINAKKKGES